MPHPFRIAVARARHALVARRSLDDASVVRTTHHDGGCAEPQRSGHG